MSRLLTDTIVFNNSLVQGSTLSPDIANLIFWDTEHQLVNDSNTLKLTYSRYADDINISSKEKLSNELKTTVIKKVNRMLESKELKLKHKKTKILNENNQMLVTGIVANNGARVPKKYIDNTYKSINNRSNINSIEGGIRYIEQTLPKKSN